jgi:hypothetical protein
MSPLAFLSLEIAKRLQGLNPGNAKHFTGRKQNRGDQFAHMIYVALRASVNHALIECGADRAAGRGVD